MPSLKDVKLQIAGVGKTKQITRAMGMVASAKLRGAQNRIERFRPYAEKFGEMLGDLAARTEEAAHPLLQVHKEVKSAVVVLLSSDRGLCGGFNVNLISTALDLARAKTEEGLSVRFICVGRKGRDAVRKTSYEIIESYGDVMGSFDFRLAARLGGKVSQLYESGEADEVYLVYSEFAGMTRQIPTKMELLPVTAAAREEDGNKPAAECLYEPEVGVLLAELLPRYVNVQIYRGLLDNSASENAARMAAMDNATRNCDELTNSLTLLYNKTRQAAITNELIDIVGGANAQQSQ
ncbi:F0F1 ATP synthase subunit gamma [uncultured Mailhella sp.]|uniref:F0F1 ATP synthase subunit gamma n=1 Tax=uncultured Mailhella sp. TaxID=1981031 RepID=UPI00320B45F7